MQSYIVRVYRRNPDNAGDVAGIIEMVGEQKKITFQDLSELQESLEDCIKSDDSEYNGYSEARQIDMYGYDRSCLNG
jgi:hypothetical protein